VIRERPELFNRFLAKAIDVTAALTLCFSVPYFGTVLGVMYLIVCDALIDGSSPAKWLIGLRCIHHPSGRSCSYKESALRNLPFEIPAAFLLIPVLGVVLSVLVGLVFLSVEAYFLYTDPYGHRLGDVLADTTVVATPPYRRSAKKTGGDKT
jgi:uncharacterized RDD family membrane protein YckC